MRTHIQSNYQDLLKTLATIIMIIDHYGAWFAPEFHALRIVGRCGIAIWLFFAGYNYSHPKSILLKLGLLITYLIYISKGIWVLNMLIVFYIGQWYIYLIERFCKTITESIFFHITLMILLAPLTIHYLEYSTLAIAYMIAGRGEAQSKGRGIKYLPLLGLSLLVITYLMFSKNFSSVELAFTCTSSALGVIALSLKKPEYETSFSIKIISRNTLWIYFVHITSFAIISICQSLY